MFPGMNNTEITITILLLLSGIFIPIIVFKKDYCAKIEFLY